MTGPMDYTGGDTGSESQGNPAWNDFLQEIPQELHPKVTPHLQKWDQGVNERFQQVHREYEPWKQFKDAGVDPQDAQFALNLLNSINENPKMVYDALAQHYQFNSTSSESGQGQAEPNSTEQDPYSAQIAEIQRQNQILAQTILSQREADQNAQQDAALDKELSGLRAKYGDYDEFYVLSRMQTGATAEEAVQQFQNFVTQEARKYAPKPLIMGAGGSGVPGQYTDVRKLDDKGTKNLVVQMLEQSKQQRNL